MSPELPNNDAKDRIMKPENALPADATRVQAAASGRNRRIVALALGGLAFAACWWFGLSGMVSSLVCILTVAAARFLPWIATAPVERAVMKRACARLCAA